MELNAGNSWKHGRNNSVFLLLGYFGCSLAAKQLCDLENSFHIQLLNFTICLVFIGYIIFNKFCSKMWWPDLPSRKTFSRERSWLTASFGCTCLCHFLPGLLPKTENSGSKRTASFCAQWRLFPLAGHLAQLLHQADGSSSELHCNLRSLSLNPLPLPLFHHKY